MHLEGKFPKITPEDHPTTIFAALMASPALYGQEMPDHAAALTKTAQDAYGALQDGFGIVDTDSDPLNPEGSALLYLSPDHLAYALVGYGVLALEGAYDTAEVANVDALLRKIDTLVA